MEDHAEVGRTILRRELQTILTASPIPLLRTALIVLTQASIRPERDQDQAEVVLALLSHSVRIAEDVASHGNLREPPWAHFATRAILEHTTDAMYVLQKPPSVAAGFKEYGRGRDKLHYKLMQDAVADAPPETQKQLAHVVEAMEKNANREEIEMFTDMRWDNWAGKDDVRKRSQLVGRDAAHRHIYAPNSDVIHGSWNTIRAYDMAHCLTPSHGGHLVPRRNYKRVSGTILGTLGGLVWEAMFETAEAWGCDKELDELLSASRKIDAQESAQDFEPRDESA